MGPIKPSTASDKVVLTAAHLATSLVRREIPPEEDFFYLAAAVVEGARRQDSGALALALAAAQELALCTPADREWNEVRGRLWSIKTFAWIFSSPGA